MRTSKYSQLIVVFKRVVKAYRTVLKSTLPLFTETSWRRRFEITSQTAKVSMTEKLRCNGSKLDTECIKISGRWSYPGFPLQCFAQLILLFCSISSTRDGLWQSCKGPITQICSKGFTQSYTIVCLRLVTSLLDESKFPKIDRDRKNSFVIVASAQLLNEIAKNKTKMRSPLINKHKKNGHSDGTGVVWCSCRVMSREVVAIATRSFPYVWCQSLNTAGY